MRGGCSAGAAPTGPSPGMRHGGDSNQPTWRPSTTPPRHPPQSASRPSGGGDEGAAGSDNRAGMGAAPPPAARVAAVPPSGIRKFFDVIATMPDVISLGVGEPDFTTPTQIIEAGVRSLRAGRTHYTSNFGTLELRRALAKHLQRLYGVEYDPEGELLITVGASEAV